MSRDALESNNWILIERAREYFVSRGKDGHPSVDTVKRWTRSGVGGVQLRAARHGGTLVTTRQWIDEFIEAVTNAGGPLAVPKTPEAYPATTSPMRLRSSEEADRRLAQLGA